MSFIYKIEISEGIGWLYTFCQIFKTIKPSSLHHENSHIKHIFSPSGACCQSCSIKQHFSCISEQLKMQADGPLQKNTSMLLFSSFKIKVSSGLIAYFHIFQSDCSKLEATYCKMFWRGTRGLMQRGPGCTQLA